MVTSTFITAIYRLNNIIGSLFIFGHNDFRITWWCGEQVSTMHVQLLTTVCTAAEAT
jgi:hypothetical protein